MPGLVKGSAALHGAGALVVIAVPRVRWMVAAGLVVNHVVLIGSGLAPRSRLLGPNLVRLPPEQSDGGGSPGAGGGPPGGAGGSPSGARAVGLTFDDGPDPEVTPRVLDLLDRYGARASFFCVGRRAERWPGLVAEIVRRGHRVENHTYGHPWHFSLSGPRGVAREVDRGQEVLAGLAGRAPRLFRPPAGFRNLWLEPVLAARGLWLTSWSRRGFDTVRGDARRVERSLSGGLEAGEILVLHDRGAAVGREGRPVVLEVLPGLLESMERAGLRGVAVEAPDGG
jgi:peptidoglycan/xylan/chitin deacetylase (PgdA/CDA1 family)